MASGGGGSGGSDRGLCLQTVRSERKLSTSDGIKAITESQNVLAATLPEGYWNLAASFKTRQEFLPVGAAVYALGHIRLDPVSNRVVFYNAGVTDQPFVVSVRSEEELYRAFHAKAAHSLVVGSALSDACAGAGAGAGASCCVDGVGGMDGMDV